MTCIIFKAQPKAQGTVLEKEKKKIWLPPSLYRASSQIRKNFDDHPYSFLH